MLVHRMLDVFFRSLDAVDAAKEKIDRLRGKTPAADPWAVDWPPADADLPKKAEAKKAEADEGKKSFKKMSSLPKEALKTERSDKGEKKTATQKKATSKKATPKKKATKKAKSRKGSVDRSGKDISTKKATETYAYLTTHQVSVIGEESELDGKKVLGRVVWALSAAEKAGIEGMSTKDVSALLYECGKIEVFATNVGRACRDHKALIEVASTEGRSKTYRLTAEGKKRATEIQTSAS